MPVFDAVEEREREMQLYDAKSHVEKAIAGLKHIKAGLPFIQVLGEVTIAEKKLKDWRAAFSEDVTD